MDNNCYAVRTGDPDDNDNGDDDSGGPDRRLHISRTLDGRREVTGSLDPETGALLENALRLVRTRPSEGDPPRTPAQRRADELADVLRWFLDHQDQNPGGRQRPHLNVFLDDQDLAGDHMPTGNPHDQATRRPPSGWLADGTILDPTTITRLVCDCTIHRIVHQGRSAILDYGQGTRTAPRALWNALVARDRHCRFASSFPMVSVVQGIGELLAGGRRRRLVDLSGVYHHRLCRPLRRSQ